MNRSGLMAVLLSGVILVFAAPGASAQAWGYPAWQPSNLTSRELNFGVAGGDPGTSGVFQWREGLSSESQFNLDVGIASPGHNADTRFLLGGGFTQRLVRATRETPIDVLFTAGLYGSFAGRSLGRIPIGVVVGHRFPMEGDVFLTPYVHPRLSIDFGGGDSQLNVNFDFGADFEMTHTLSLRPAISVGSIGGSGSDVSFGLSLAYHPLAARSR